MLIVFSDVHLTDESTAGNVHASAFERLSEEIEDAAQQKAARELHVLLLGDIFDLVRTGWWHEQQAAGKLSVADRPWNGTLDPSTGMNADVTNVESQFQQVLKGILRTESCRALLAMLNDLPAVGGQRPAVTYVIGNHDRALHNFPSLQDALRRRPGRSPEGQDACAPAEPQGNCALSPRKPCWRSASNRTTATQFDRFNDRACSLNIGRRSHRSRCAASSSFGKPAVSRPNTR
jgi:hypothetical protein